MSTTIEPGSLVRVTEDHKMGEDGDEVSKGSEFTIDEYVPAGDPEQDYLPFDWYMGIDEYGSYREAAADKVELVKSAAQMAARRIPTAEEIVAALDCLNDYDGFRITEADRPEGGSRELAGHTEDGLYFACTITVSNVYQGDF